jgi:hypothetical protein
MLKSLKKITLKTWNSKTLDKEVKLSREDLLDTDNNCSRVKYSLQAFGKDLTNEELAMAVYDLLTYGSAIFDTNATKELAHLRMILDGSQAEARDLRNKLELISDLSGNKCNHDYGDYY